MAYARKPPPQKEPPVAISSVKNSNKIFGPVELTTDGDDSGKPDKSSKSVADNELPSLTFSHCVPQGKRNCSTLN